MVAEGATEAEARGRSWLVDSSGLVVKSAPGLNEHKLRYAHEHAPVGDFLSAIKDAQADRDHRRRRGRRHFHARGAQDDGRDQQAADHLRAVQPDVEGGMHGRGGLQPDQRAGAVRLRQPLRSGDVRRQDLRAAPGQQLLHLPRRRPRRHRERHRLVTDEMFMAAAHTLAQMVSEADLEQGSLYPALPQIREVSAQIAAAVAAVAYQRGLADGPAPNDLRALVRSQMYDPHY